jgi:hypothetical protein
LSGLAFVHASKPALGICAKIGSEKANTNTIVSSKSLFI